MQALSILQTGGRNFSASAVHRSSGISHSYLETAQTVSPDDIQVLNYMWSFDGYLNIHNERSIIRYKQLY
jgi:hypothetical protein